MNKSVIGFTPDTIIFPIMVTDLHKLDNDIEELIKEKKKIINEKYGSDHLYTFSELQIPSYLPCEEHDDCTGITRDEFARLTFRIKEEDKSDEQ